MPNGGAVYLESTTFGVFSRVDLDDPTFVQDDVVAMIT